MHPLVPLFQGDADRVRAMSRTKRLLVLLLLLSAVGLGAWHVGWYAWGKLELRAARAALENRDFAAAQGHLAGCLRAWPHDPETLLLAAQVARRAGDLKEAIRLQREYQQLHGVTEGLALERRLFHFQGGDTQTADTYLAHCAEALDSPETPLVLEALIEGSIRSGDLARAMAAANLWLERARSKADEVQGHVWRGDVWIQIGSAENAMPEFVRAVELDGDNDTARLHWAAALAASDPGQALEHLQRLLQKHPGDPTIRHQVARCRRYQGQLDEAARLLDELLAEYPDDFAVVFERGAVALELGESVPAERWLRRACVLSPDNPKVQRILARCLRQNGKAEEGKEFEERATQTEARRAVQARQLLEVAPPPAP